MTGKRNPVQRRLGETIRRQIFENKKQKLLDKAARKDVE